MEGAGIVVLVIFIWVDIVVGHNSAWLFDFALVDVADEEIIIFVPFVMVEFTDYLFLLGLLDFNSLYLKLVLIQ